MAQQQRLVFSSSRTEALNPRKRTTGTKHKLIEEFHANGITKEKGKLIYGKKEGEWEYYNEESVLVKELIYNDDHLMQTIDYKE